MSDIKVQKADGSVEEFDKDKTFNSLIGAAATPEQAEKVTNQIEQWLKDTSVVSISTNQIKTKVTEFLKAENPPAAKLYEEFDRPR